ncbi:SMI1/KNR4 family protein [Nonomuraea aridisoli]|uniref:SMI1/KNR4 family protein n=1 Tax=Nonomuraea aridisoli TaxID=2070368 RepID=UPI0015E8AB0A|nr:SMI1/KNR4 family protein [Nonomuraea aridisoli]
MAQWPPAPILGTPTVKDAERYAAKPSVLDRPSRPLPPRQPLDEATRRGLTRWAVAGLVLVVLAAGVQALESAVFSGGTEEVTVATTEQGGVTAVLGDLDEPIPDHAAVRDPVPSPSYVSSSDADCRPRQAAPRVRKVDAKVTRAVNRQWRRIEAWLEKNAPRSRRTLAGPAKPQAIAAAEAELGLRFPDDLRASLLRHNGSRFVTGTGAFGFLGHANLSVREIRENWRMLCEIDSQDMGGDPRTDWWDGRMLPVSDDGMGNHLVVDSARRDVGQTDHEGVMSFRPAGLRIRSYYALLKTTADALEQGRSIGYLRPKAVGGELAWDVS